MDGNGRGWIQNGRIAISTVQVEFIQGQEWFENNIKKEIKEQYYQGLHLCKALFNALDLKYKDTVWKIIETYIPKDSLRYKYEMAMYHFKENEYKKAFSLLSEICNVTLEEGYRINKDYPYLFREMQNARLVLARMCLKGSKEDKAEIKQHLVSILWTGRVDKAIDRKSVV